MRKELNDEQTRLARRFPASTKTEAENAYHQACLNERWKCDQGGLMSYGTCRTLPPVFLLSSWFFQDSSDLNSIIKTSNSLCFYFSLRVSLMFDVLHTVINSVYVQTLPTEQATSVVTDFFREVMTPSLMPARPGL